MLTNALAPLLRPGSASSPWRTVAAQPPARPCSARTHRRAELNPPPRVHPEAIRALARLSAAAAAAAAAAGMAATRAECAAMTWSFQMHCEAQATAAARGRHESPEDEPAGARAAQTHAIACTAATAVSAAGVFIDKERIAALSAAKSAKARREAAAAEKSLSSLRHALGEEWTRGSGISLDGQRVDGGATSRAGTSRPRSTSEGVFKISCTWVPHQTPIGEAALGQLRALLAEHAVAEREMLGLAAALRRGSLPPSAVEELAIAAASTEVVPASKWATKAVRELIEQRRWTLVRESR